MAPMGTLRRNKHMDDRLEDIREIVAYARSKGNLNYDEINDLLPADFNSSEDMDFLFQVLDDQGIDVLEKDQQDDLSILRKGRRTGDSPLGYDPDLERTSDPVKMYLREMGQTPLLNREGRGPHSEEHRTRPQGHDQGPFQVPIRGPHDPRHRRGDQEGPGSRAALPLDLRRHGRRTVPRLGSSRNKSKSSIRSGTSSSRWRRCHPS